MSALWSVASAHLQSGVNRVRRQQGNMGIWLSVFIFALALLMVLPLFAAMGFFGFLLGDGVADGDPNHLSYLAIFITGITVLGGIFGGLGGSTRQLPWESLQAYPVSPRVLFAAELLAGGVEILTLIELLALFSICFGVAIAAPSSLPFLLIIFVTGTLTLLGLQLLVGSLTQRISKQTRVMIFLLPMLALTVPLLVPRVTALITQEGVVNIGQWILKWALKTPAGLVLQAAQHAHTGDWSFAAPRVLISLGLVLLLIPISYLAVSRERDADVLSGDGSAKKLWTFRTVRMGIARLQFESLTTSLIGKLTLLMPLLTVLLLRFPMSELTGRGAWLVPTAFLYAGLSGVNLLFNQFGLDRHGVKSLLLLPIEERDLLAGKSMGFALWQSLQIVALVLLLGLTGHNSPWQLLLGAMMSICTFQIFLMVGQFVSIWLPRPLQKTGMQGSQPPLMVVLVTLLTVSIGSGSLLALTWVCKMWLPPSLEWLGMAGVALVLFALTFPVRAFNAKFLKAHRENLAETLGAAA